MLKSKSHRADFSFDRIGLIPRICRHQSSIQDLLAFLQPFNVLSYGAIHKVASVRKRTERLRHNPLEIVRRLLSVFPTNPESGSGLLSETIQNAAMLDDGECPEAIVFQLK